MSTRPPTWWELGVVAETLGYGHHDEVRRLWARLVRDGIIASDEFLAERRENPPGVRGRPRDLLFLAPSAVVAISAHARTPEAARFRREALARLAEPTAPALPSSAPVVWADDTPQQLAELRARVERLEAGHEEVRRAIIAPAVQLALFRKWEASKDRGADLLDALDRLCRAVGKPSGIPSNIIVDYARAGVAEAVEVLELAGAPLVGSSAPRLGYAFRSLVGRKVGGRILRRAYVHNSVARWFVESEVVQ